MNLLERLADRLDSWEDVVLKIDDIEIEGVQRSRMGVYRFKDRNRRTKIQHSKLGEWRGYRITSKSLRKLIWIYGRLTENGYRVRRLDQSLLVEIVKRMLGCSTQTAYNYAHTLIELRLCCSAF